MKELSSPYTFFYKYIYQLLWMAGCFLGTKDVLLAGPSEPRFAQYLMIWALFSLFIHFCTGSIKKVTLEGTTLRVSNYLSEQQVSVSEIQSVGGSSFMSPRQVWFIINEAGNSGRKISFIPAGTRVRGPGKHPMVKELAEELEIKVAG